MKKITEKTRFFFLEHPFLITYFAWAWSALSLILEYRGFAAKGFFAASGSILVGTVVMSEIMLSRHVGWGTDLIEHLRRTFVDIAKGKGTTEMENEIESIFEEPASLLESTQKRAKWVFSITVVAGSVIWGYGTWWV